VSVLEQVSRESERLARLEAVGEVLAAETSREVVKWFCVECKRFFPKKPGPCVAESHTLQPRKVRMHAFGCGSCGAHISSEQAVHLAPCKRCGKVQWASESIHASARSASSAAEAPPVPEFDPRGGPVEESLRGMGLHSQFS